MKKRSKKLLFVRPRYAVGVAVIATLAGDLLILLSITVIDRPVARFMASHVHDRLPFIAMAAIANLPGPLASLFLAGTVLACWGGITPSATSRRWIVAAIATLAALMIKDQLKFDFGRVWPLSHPLPGIHNHPSFIGDHVFGFFPFHGGTSYASFPSGHTTAITAPMAVLWVSAPRYRALWASLVVIVVAGLIADDFHFVSDIIGGLMVGIAAGAGSLTLARSGGFMP